VLLLAQNKITAFFWEFTPNNQSVIRVTKVVILGKLKGLEGKETNG